MPITKSQSLRALNEVVAECRARDVKESMVLNRGWFSFLDNNPHLLRQPKHRHSCLTAFVQGWINGSLSTLIDQELTRQETARN
jgi:hypothetical protein